MPGLIAATVYLAAMGMVGVALLRRAVSCLTPLEYVAYGIPLGAVIVTLALLPLATLFGLSTVLVLMVGLLCGVIALLIWPYPQAVPVSWDAFSRINLSLSRCAVEAALRSVGRRMNLLPVLIVGAFLVRWFVLFNQALTYREDGLWAGHINIWGDWALHLGDVASFAYGDNFPPTDPRFLHHASAYHFLTSLTAATTVKLSLDPATALSFQSFVFTALMTLAIYAFARRLTRDRSIASLALVLFFLGGSLGWLVVAGDVNLSNDFLGTLLREPWDQGRQSAAGFEWQNLFFGLILPQRGHFYGLPLALLALTLLLMAVQSGERRYFLLAGGVAGLLPLAHTSTLVALALMTPFLFLLFPSRGWFLFFAVWVAIALPQIYFQQGGERGETAAMRIQLGWLAGNNLWLWLWFWLKNLGWFSPLLLMALADRNLVPRAERRLLWAFMPLFVISNVIVFRPWDWDNTKVFLYWFLGVSILVAALLIKTWRAYPGLVVRCFIVVAVVSMILSGLLVNLHQLLGKSRYVLLSTEELQLGQGVRVQTPPHSVFAAGLQHNHPVLLVAGRQVLMSFPGWHFAFGVDYRQREADLRALFEFKPDAPDIIRRYGIDYVVVGPNERQELKANVEAFRSRYPVVVKTPNYEVFAVGERQASQR